MESINLRVEDNRGLLEGYKINDPTGQSIYDFLINRSYTEQEVNQKLNRPLIWDTNNDDYIILKYSTVYGIVSAYYIPEQLNNSFALLGLST